MKGKGVSFMEGLCDWHGKAPSAEQAAQALAELPLDQVDLTEVEELPDTEDVA